MSFSPHSSNYNSAAQQPSQPQTMNTFNNQGYYQNVTQITGYPYSYSNNYQYPQINYTPPMSSNYNQGYFYPSKTPDTTITVSKREYKPLTVIDPQKNEAINLHEVCKVPKSCSLLNEIQNNLDISEVSSIVSQNIKSDFDKVKLINQVECIENNKDNIDMITKNEIVIDKKTNKCDTDHYNGTDQEDISKYTDCEPIDDSEKDNEPTIPQISENHQNLKSLSSIPDNLETSSSSDCLSQTEISTSETGRLIYDRDTLIKISKSPLCRKPILDCKDIIEAQGNNKAYNLTNRLTTPNKSLNCTLTGYKAPCFRPEKESSDNYLEISRRNFKCVLNKIAPQNFQLCFSEIINLLTTTDWKDVLVKDYMDCLIEEIFAKAVQEEGYSVTYADLCTEIVKYEQQHEMKWAFKNYLIERCKHMFETPLQDQLIKVRSFWETKAELEKDKKLRNLYKSEIEEQVKKAKDKYFGNIRFIGELYLHELLKAGIINICVTSLMPKRKDEDALLSLCKLLETCGKKFDKNHNDKMKEYIQGMTEITENEDLPNRIKFRLLDIIDMSERGWVLRTIQAQKIIQPKTLDQVKKDDLDEKKNEASKLLNKTPSRLKKKQNTVNPDLKFKSTQNRNQSLDFNSLQMQSNDNFELKPSYGLWASGSGSKDTEWQNVECKRNTRFNRTNMKNSQYNKSSPITSRDESPSKTEIGGRFALLQQNDVDDSITTKIDTLFPRQSTPESDKEKIHNITSVPSTREQSPIESKCDVEIYLSADNIFQDLLDTHSLDVRSWRRLSDVSQIVNCWVDKIMEKGKSTRNLVGDEFAKLIADGLLSMDDLIQGIQTFSEEIDDLKTDIPLIWNFMAEFLERLIINADSDISFYKTIFESQKSTNDVANCISLCLKYAADRLGQDVIKKVFTKCNWSFEDFGETTETFLRLKNLDFLLETEVNNPLYFDKYRYKLISLLPNDDEVVNQYLDDNFGSEIIQTEECVYFVSCCVFSHISNLSPEEITTFLDKKKLFFLRLLFRRSEFEKRILEALNDSIDLFKEKESGLLEAVIYGLSDNILSYEAFQQFLQNADTCSGTNIDSDDSDDNRHHISKVIRSMFETRRWKFI